MKVRISISVIFDIWFARVFGRFGVIGAAERDGKLVRALGLEHE